MEITVNNNNNNGTSNNNHSNSCNMIHTITTITTVTISTTTTTITTTTTCVKGQCFIVCLHLHSTKHEGKMWKVKKWEAKDLCHVAVRERWRKRREGRDLTDYIRHAHRVLRNMLWHVSVAIFNTLM